MDKEFTVLDWLGDSPDLNPHEEKAEGRKASHHLPGEANHGDKEG
jgi:hypothetical protein